NDRQGSPARGSRRAGLVQHPLPGHGRIRAAQGLSLCHGGSRSAWAASALEAWEHWCAQATQSQIPALELFAQRLKTYWHGILARCRHPLDTSVVEGINNTIKVIKRRAYGYRDEEYFFLKIKAAFPGIPR